VSGNARGNEARDVLLEVLVDLASELLSHVVIAPFQ
jgi:hypothetical protein